MLLLGDRKGIWPVKSTDMTVFLAHGGSISPASKSRTLLSQERCFLEAIEQGSPMFLTYLGSMVNIETLSYYSALRLLVGQQEGHPTYNSTATKKFTFRYRLNPE